MTAPHVDDSVRSAVLLASAALGAELVEPEPLGGSDRSLVLRCRVAPRALTGRRDLPPTVVVKVYPEGEAAGASFARESVGLTTVGRAPSLLAADSGRRVLVMTDLGRAPTLADLLLGSDGPAAWEAALTWAATLGDALGTSHHRSVEVSRSLAGHGLTTWDASADAARGARRVRELLGAGAVLDGRLEGDLARLAVLSQRDAERPGPPADVVSPGDTCPDNAVLTAHGWRFVDLEGATVQHVALDAAYTVLPFATCWCVFDTPPGLTEALFERFTSALGRHLPETVAEPGWSELVDLACGAWVLAMTGWLLDGAIRGRPRVGPPGRPSPSYRQLVVARWRWGGERLAGRLPAVAAGLGAAAERAQREWGEDGAGVGPYPAFAASARRMDLGENGAP